MKVPLACSERTGQQYHSSAFVMTTKYRDRFKLVKTKKVWKEVKGKERGLSVLEWRLEDQ